ncbi:MAG: hypothetical protein LBC97_01765 [Bifidobacteriaceae bacterium]|jgi:secretion/DNA translocation related TadE-like protein|nr:hypothetical protein [Bifidobacteriaceae bacterium]
MRANLQRPQSGRSRGAVLGDDCAQRDRGSGTVLAVGLVGALAAAALALATVAGALIARERAVTAADLAALGGAQALIDGQDLAAACQASGQVAQLMGADQTECVRAPPDRLTVTCRLTVQLPPFGTRSAVASAQAGPP